MNHDQFDKYKFSYGTVSYIQFGFILQMLFSSDNKSLGNSTLATTQGSTRSMTKSAPKKKDNFIIYSFKQIWSLLTAFWTRFRKFMWIGSTGFIILVVPFVFSYMQEMQNQMIRMMEMQNGNRMM